MTRFSSRLLRLAGAGTLLAVAGCGDLLDVTNKNNPDQQRVLSAPGDVEALIRGSYIQALGGLTATNSINMQLGAVAFENSPMAANFGMIERSALPRTAIGNTTSNTYASYYYDVWASEYAAIRSASDGLARFATAGFTLGSAASDARARAFGHFVLFFAHANLAITYDSASVYDESIAASSVEPFKGPADVMAAALTYADSAINIATANPTISFPADWMGVAVDAPLFIKLVNSFKARYIMENARKAADLTTADYDKVIAAVNAGITSDYSVVDDDDKWDRWSQDYMSFRGAWAQVPYVVYGMADQSGAYQTWITTAVASRTPIVVVTPDLRFPQGATFAAQQAAPGKYIRAKTNTSGEGGWVRAERGTWRWSNYVDKRYQAYYNANNTGVALPYFQYKELQLYKAEALYKKGDKLGAATIVNATRVADGGLNAMTAADTPADNVSCVPKLPDGTCGNLWEALKWEKRMVHYMEIYGGWYFDSRRWGDLPQYTYLDYPVPAKELEVRQKPVYTYGGSADASGHTQTTVGTYGY